MNQMSWAAQQENSTTQERNRLLSVFRSFNQNKFIAQSEFTFYFQDPKNRETLVRFSHELVMHHDYTIFQIFRASSFSHVFDEVMVRMVQVVIQRFDPRIKNIEMMFYVLEIIHHRSDLFQLDYYETLFTLLTRFTFIHLTELSYYPNDLCYIFKYFNQLLSMIQKNEFQITNIESFESSLTLILQILHTGVGIEDMQEPMYVFFECVLEFINYIEDSRLFDIAVKYLDCLFSLSFNGDYNRGMPIAIEFFKSIDPRLVDKRNRAILFSLFDMYLVAHEVNSPSFYHLVEAAERVLIDSNSMNKNSSQFTVHYCVGIIELISERMQESPQLNHYCMRRLITTIARNGLINGFDLSPVQNQIYESQISENADRFHALMIQANSNVL